MSGLIMGATYQIFNAFSTSTYRVNTSGKAEQDLKRFITLISNDIEQAGSDPTGIALQAYMEGPDCGTLLSFDYGINPAPSNAACDESLGEIGILSYLAYDQDVDGQIMPEEGLDLVSDPPTLRASQDDYIVYDYYDSDADGNNDRLRRRNMGDVDDDGDDTAEDVLKNVASFDMNYYGIRTGLLGDYGLIDDISFYNDIREVELVINVWYGKEEGGYVNPFLASDSPWLHFRTVQKIFRVSINVIKPETS